MNIQKKLKEIGFDSIEQFVGYCEEHCQTPRALFKKEHLALMIRLAGNPKNYPRPQEVEAGFRPWYSLHAEMGDLVDRYKLITKRLKESNTFKDLLEVAMMILSTTNQPVSMVSGPISTGGKGSQELNIFAMQDYIEELYKDGENVFDQTPFEEPMQRIKKHAATYDYALLNEFYLPIFESGYIKKMFFMYDWESSIGASWEHEQMIRLRIERRYQALKV
jgi:hypothetical protein